MAATTAILTAITKMVRGRTEVVLINVIVVQYTLNSVWNLVNQLAAFARNFATTKWGGKYDFLPLVLTETRIRFAAGNHNLNCMRLENPELLN